MQITKKCLGFERPFLHSLLDYCIERYSQEERLDMRSVTVAFPISRASRRFLELLVERAAESKLVLLPPKLITQGSLPEQFYVCDKEICSDFQRIHFWISALREFSSADLESLIPFLPKGDDFQQLAVLAKQMDGLWSEIAGADIPIEIIKEAAKKREVNFSRWEVFESLLEIYKKQLLSKNFLDVNFARQLACENPNKSFEGELILAGTVQLNSIAKKLISLSGAKVNSFIYASTEDEERFDDFGCIVKDSWLEKVVEVLDDKVGFAQDARGQANQLLKVLDSLDSAVSYDDVVIGSTDDKLTPFIEQALDLVGLPLRPAAGRSASRSGPIYLLKAISAYLGSKSFDDFSSLIRCADIERYLSCQGLLERVDSFYSKHLPSKINKKILKSLRAPSELISSFEKLESLLTPFEQNKLEISAWPTEILKLIDAVYGKSLEDSVSAEIRDSFSIIRNCFSEFQNINDENKISGAEALSFVHWSASQELIYSANEGQAIELLGWLELSLDDADNCIVLGMNEGLAPEVLNGDIFFPDSFRREIGLVDNDERLARDTYVLSTLVQGKNNSHFIAGRRKPSGEAMLLSRLLLSGRSDVVSKRVSEFYSDSQEQIFINKDKERAARSYQPVILDGYSAPSSMSVTSFRDYISSPYRYYLRHILKLSLEDDALQELDGAGFGVLAHEVLAEFANSDLAQSVSEDEIKAGLRKISRKTAKKMFGDSPRAAVLVQVEQLLGRFDNFARWQAEWREQGWKIEHTELYIDDSKSFLELSSGKKMGLRGVIDRIDRNEKTGEWAVIDYKTADVSKSAEEAHRFAQLEWKDLQLPLYVELLKSKNIKWPFKLGYLNLAKDTEEVHPSWVDWNESEIIEAIDLATNVAEGVAAGRFEEIDASIKSFDDYAILCGLGAYSHVASEVSEND